MLASLARGFITFARLDIAYRTHSGIVPLTAIFLLPDSKINKGAKIIQRVQILFTLKPNKNKLGSIVKLEIAKNAQTISF